MVCSNIIFTVKNIVHDLLESYLVNHCTCIISYTNYIIISMHFIYIVHVYFQVQVGYDHRQESEGYE